MAQILIRNIPDDIMQKLRRRAKAADRPLEHTVRQILIAEGNRPNRASVSRKLLENFDTPVPAMTKKGYRDGLA